jgi:hypothetical protein
MMESNCAVCAPRVTGKHYAMMTTSAEAQGIKSWHVCVNGTRPTSRVVSWHSTRDAAYRAAKAFHKTYRARAYVINYTPRPGAKANNGVLEVQVTAS